MKATGLPISWLTCYDYSFATALSESDLDMILVGDSGGMVALGYSDTVPVTMDEMVLLSAAVRRGAPNKFIVGDMPKGSYEASDTVAVNNAMRFFRTQIVSRTRLMRPTHPSWIYRGFSAFVYI